MNDQEREPVAVVFSYDVAFASKVSVELRANGELSSAVVTRNFDGGWEIGLYQLALDDQEFRAALAALRASKYESIQFEPVMPDTPFFTFGERHADENRARTSRIPMVDVAPEVIALADELNRFVFRIRQHRSRVLGGRARWEKAALQANEPLAVRVALECTGPLPVVVSNPLGAPSSFTGLSLNVKGQGTWEGVMFGPKHLRRSLGAPTDAAVTLSPGDKLEFGVEKKVFLAPGVYSGQFEYTNAMTRPGDPQFIEGTLDIDLGPVTVQ